MKLNITLLSVLLLTGVGGGSAQPEAGYLNGFGKTLAGETIDYHSVNEFARLALLVRTTDGSMAIEWQTDRIPSNAEESSFTYAWLAAISGSKGRHRFDLFVNGTKCLSFFSAEDSSRKSFAASGGNGALFTFTAMEVDRFQDMFGYSSLTVPAGLLTKGQPLTIRIVGEAGGSPAWYMTFQHPLRAKTMAVSLPALVNDASGLCQLVQISIEQYGPPHEVSIALNGKVKVVRQLVWGTNSVAVPVQAVTKRTVSRVAVLQEGKEIFSEAVILKPVQKRELYLLPHSHTDIGYTAYQVDVQNNHIAHIEQALTLAQQTAQYPKEAKSRWNIEVLWELESYLDRATEGQKKEVIAAIKAGSIGVNALYTNTLTGLCRPEELLRLTQYARWLEAEYGVDIRAAMITDIPAYTCSIVPALGTAGIRYFSSGPNYAPTMPDGGDRIGHALQAWADRPFYWKSQSGEHKILFWMAGRGYSWFHGWIMGKLSQSNPAHIFHYLDELDSLDYPYDMVQLRYTVDGDNGPPDPDLPDFVRTWNERYVSPKFVISTTFHMFEEFEHRYGSVLPTYQGDLTPYWEDGAASTAREVAMNRNSAEQLIQASALYSILNPLAYEPKDFAAAWRQVLLWDEHTWGAWNSISDPDSASVIAQWEYKRSFAVEGARQAAGLLQRIANPGGLVSEKVAALDIVNTTSWPRTDLVIIPATVKLNGPQVKDHNGYSLPSQVLTTGELAVFVRDVPPLGVTRLFFEEGRPLGGADAVTAAGTILHNTSVRVAVNPHTGAISRFLWEPGGQDFVDTSQGAGLNEYLYVPGRDPRKARRDSAVSVVIKERGPVVASLLIQSAPAGCSAVRREVRLVQGLGRVDIIDTLDKKRIREKESVHLAFPFRVPEGIVRIDGGWEVVRLPEGQLQGACKDFFCVQRWVDVSNGAFGVTLASVDAPLVEVGAMTDETQRERGCRVWKTILPASQTVFSYVMNNYWHTNYKADQEGTVTLRYSLMPHGQFDATAATQFGTEQSQPLIVADVHRSVVPGQSLLTVTPASVIVTSLAPSANGNGWIVRLFNTGERPEQVSVAWYVQKGTTFFSSDLSEQRRQPVRFPITISGRGIVTLRVDGN